MEKIDRWYWFRHNFIGMLLQTLYSPLYVIMLLFWYLKGWLLVFLVTDGSETISYIPDMMYEYDE